MQRQITVPAYFGSQYTKLHAVLGRADSLPLLISCRASGLTRFLTADQQQLQRVEVCEELRQVTSDDATQHRNLCNNGASRCDGKSLHFYSGSSGFKPRTGAAMLGEHVYE
jgi:hypothetical protein